MEQGDGGLRFQPLEKAAIRPDLLENVDVTLCGNNGVRLFVPRAAVEPHPLDHFQIKSLRQLRRVSTCFRGSH